MKDDSHQQRISVCLGSVPGQRCNHVTDDRKSCIGLKPVSYEYHEQTLFELARDVETGIGARRPPPMGSKYAQLGLIDFARGAV